MKHQKHLVVDGSNIATEGRDRPSLAQLDEAVRSFLEERPYEKVTVVVDATFGHRIEKKERKAFEAAAASNELVTPPAGAVGRGDAFVLQIANRVGADVLSNDSFQEFHGMYDWLFDEHRLFGGKPVPGVGWIFVPRLPVRGPTSRKSMRDARDKPRKRVVKPGAVIEKIDPEDATAAAGPIEAAEPLAEAETDPTLEAIDAIHAIDAGQPAAAPAHDADGARVAKGQRGGRRERDGNGRGKALNEPLVYAGFVIDHPLGSVVEGTVESFSSHGAYVMVGPVRCYLPLKALGNPPPRSAREVVKVGETRPFVVERFNPDRRGIDLSLADAGASSERDHRVAEAVAVAAEDTTKRQQPEEALVSPAAKKATATRTTARKASSASAKKAPAKKTTTRKAAPAAKATTARKTAAKKTPARKTPAKKAPAKKTSAKKAPARKTSAKKAPAAKKTTARKALPAKKTTAKTTGTTAKKAPARKTSAKKAPAARKTTARASAGR